MRLAIFGDIHGNLEALRAVLQDAKDHQVTHFVCLGDIVGYGASPRECIEEVQRLRCPVVKGNHDEMAAQVDDLKAQKPLVRESVLWTRNRLTMADKQWLRTLKLVQQISVPGIDEFIIVHSTLDRPSLFGHVHNHLEAAASFSFQHTQLCFIGHTHAPGAYVHNGTVRAELLSKLHLESGKRYLVNVGSVGQPRDGDWRAAYCLYDPVRKNLDLRRVEYDFRLAREKFFRAGVPPGLHPVGLDPMAGSASATRYVRAA